MIIEREVQRKKKEKIEINKNKGRTIVRLEQTLQIMKELHNKKEKEY